MSLSPVEIITSLMLLLLVAALVLAVCKKIKIPFTVSLVIVGILISQAGYLFPSHYDKYLHVNISPDFIFYSHWVYKSTGDNVLRRLKK